MEEISAFDEKEVNRIFRRSFRKAFIASWSAGSTLFGGFLVGFIFLKQLNYSWFESVSAGLLVYISYLLYYFPKVYGMEYNLAFNRLYADSIAKNKDGISTLSAELRDIRIEIAAIRHYGKSHAYLSAAFAIIHKMNRVENLTFEMAVAELGKFCTLIKEFFEVKNGAKCACCIKILIKGDNLEHGDFRVITLCRDSRSDVDREPATATRIHTVKHNTCFLHFFENINNHEGKYFFSNDLTAQLEYQNSSIDYYRNSTQGPWKLPYKSEIVVPLIAKIPDDNTPVLGFFCVDSEGVGNFNSEFDPEMLIGVADGLYNTLHNQVNKKYGIASRE